MTEHQRRWSLPFSFFFSHTNFWIVWRGCQHRLHQSIASWQQAYVQLPSSDTPGLRADHHHEGGGNRVRVLDVFLPPPYCKPGVLHEYISSLSCLHIRFPFNVQETLEVYTFQLRVVHFSGNFPSYRTVKEELSTCSPWKKVKCESREMKVGAQNCTA